MLYNYLYIMKKLFLIITLTLICNCSKVHTSSSYSHENGTRYIFTTIGTLPSSINESSGIIAHNKQLYTHNDSGDTPSLFKIDTTGRILNKTTYQNINNYDWEDISNSEKHVYIADIGNNAGNRKDLTIYQINISDIENSEAVSNNLHIDYIDQNDFSIRNQQHPFDAEAIVYVQDKLLLFSKDWKNFTTNVYNVPLKDTSSSLKATHTLAINGLITGATTNNQGTITLCGYNSNLEAFVTFIKTDQKGYTILDRYNLPLEGAQVEAITYYDSNEKYDIYYLTSEAVSIKLGDEEANSPGELYKLKVKRD